MRTEFSSASILGRSVFAGIVLSAIYLFYGPPNYIEMEMINSVFYLLIVAPISVIGTILFSFLIGTPIRMIPSVFKWWYDHPYIPISLLAFGIVLCHMSGNSNFAHSHTLTFDDEVKTEYTPNLKLLYSGWLIVGF